ncbi:class II aldolase/adducin family protein [Metabacillus arenae]|uniref:Class II aldolase/adducin family protein n=1 Tax=Metabacillus arenae TaxID=2771434 RepID=A0A926RZ70_9BACI|nr:class II aldolase/adducin family protein [Metabacillus arenae]MBD1382801.1 class II aldolase/adducin family protein [Metabacillus arenae]
MSYKKEVVFYAQKASANGLSEGTAGNVSIRNGDRMYITPSALPYDQMEEADVLTVDIRTGAVLEGERKPSTETPMHRFIYLKDDRIGAIVHTHSRYATMFACAHMPIPPVHYVIANIGREIPVAPYATYGSEQLAHNAVQTLGDNNGTLLANHGVIAIGDHLKEAYNRAEVIEEVAELAYGSYMLKSLHPLSDKDLDDALENFKMYISG